MTLRILWLTLIASQILFHGVFWFVSNQNPPSNIMPSEAIYVLTLLGALLPLAAPFASQAMVRNALRSMDDPSLSKILPPYFTAFVLGLALREAGAILGALVLLLFQDVLMWAIPAAIALVSTIAAAPRLEGIRALADASQRRGLGNHGRPK